MIKISPEWPIPAGSAEYSSNGSLSESEIKRDRLILQRNRFPKSKEVILPIFSYTSAVPAARRKVTSETMQGRAFNGPAAEERKLVDDLLGSWEEFLALILEIDSLV